MVIPVQEAAAALLPLLSAGGEAALGRLAKQAGETVAEAASRLAQKLRRSIRHDDPDLAEVEAALRSGLADGSLTESDVRIVASVTSIAGDQTSVGGNVTIGGSVYSRNVINIHGRPEK
jgi:hypothetical protein